MRSIMDTYITFINVLFNTPNMTNFNHDEDLINQQ